MELIHFILDQLHNPEHLIRLLGYPGLFFTIFAESGLFFGFFLPGDSLLFIAGFLASQGVFDIWILLIGFFLSAVLGDSVGYWMGKKLGKQLLKRKDSFFFHHEHIMRAERFYEKHGKKTIVLARFLPIVRTFAPIVAGIAHMKYRTFLEYNIIGGLVWGVGLPLVGFFLGKLIPPSLFDKYLVAIVLGIVVLSLIPSIVHYIQERKISQID